MRKFLDRWKNPFFAIVARNLALFWAVIDKVDTDENIWNFFRFFVEMEKNFEYLVYKCKINCSYCNFHNFLFFGLRIIFSDTYEA